MHELNDLYAVLGVTPSAPYEVIRAAYRAMARLHHPDINKQTPNAPSQMVRINQAYEILSCPQRRREYDLARMQAQKQATPKLSHGYPTTHQKFGYPATVLTTYDHRGRLHAYT